MAAQNGVADRMQIGTFEFVASDQDSLNEDGWLSTGQQKTSLLLTLFRSLLTGISSSLSDAGGEDSQQDSLDVKSWSWVAFIVLASGLTIGNNCIVISYLVMKPLGQQTVLDRRAIFSPILLACNFLKFYA